MTAAAARSIPNEQFVTEVVRALLKALAGGSADWRRFTRSTPGSGPTGPPARWS